MRPHALLLTGILFPAVLAPDALRAQSFALAPGSWRLGGTASIGGFRDIGNDNRIFTIELSPRVGYFLLNGLSFDANLRFARSSNQGTTNYLWGVGPGVTYYLGQPDWRGYPSLRHARCSRSPSSVIAMRGLGGSA